jgi:hypothetical protein
MTDVLPIYPCPPIIEAGISDRDAYSLFPEGEGAPPLADERSGHGASRRTRTCRHSGSNPYRRDSVKSDIFVRYAS